VILYQALCLHDGMMETRFLQTLLCLTYLLLGISAFTPLSDETLQNLPSAGTDFDIHDGAILAPILIPRVAGTPGSKLVQQHFVDWFQLHLPKWTIEFQNSTSKTPATGDKQIPFVNIIITRDPPWTKPGDVGRLALVAHYDSKMEDTHQTPPGFIGATDSAAPCAIIMHAARSVDEALTKKWTAMEAEGLNGLEEEKGVQILLLDGEEAMVEWTDTDSLYGARYGCIQDRFGRCLLTLLDHWPSPGSRLPMLRCPRTTMPSVPSPSSFFWIFSVHQTQTYRRSSKPPIGHTNISPSLNPDYEH